jgi:hypothetical protein
VLTLGSIVRGVFDFMLSVSLQLVVRKKLGFLTL